MITPEQADEAWLDAVEAIRARLQDDDGAIAAVWDNTHDQRVTFDAATSIGAMLVQQSAYLMNASPEAVLDQVSSIVLGDDQPS